MKAASKPVAFVDAQGLKSIQDMLAELLGALPRESDLKGRVLGFIAKDSPIRKVLEALASGTKTGEAFVSAYWREAYNGIRDALRATSMPPLLVIDEFSFLLKNILERNPKEGRDEADQLLAAMREWRDAGMKMLLTGSIGVTALSRKYGLSREHLVGVDSLIAQWRGQGPLDLPGGVRATRESGRLVLHRAARRQSAR
jgi:hypothetical protein